MSIFYKNILLVSSVVILTTYSQLILRLRLTKLRSLYAFENISADALLKVGLDPWIISSIGAFVLSFICWSIALSNDINSTKAYPVGACLVIFFVSAANLAVFQDKINFMNILGGLFILLGIFLLLK